MIDLLFALFACLLRRVVSRRRVRVAYSKREPNLIDVGKHIQFPSTLLTLGVGERHIGYAGFGGGPGFHCLLGHQGCLVQLTLSLPRLGISVGISITKKGDHLLVQSSAAGAFVSANFRNLTLIQWAMSLIVFSR